MKAYILLSPAGILMPAYTNNTAQAVKLHATDGLGSEWHNLSHSGFKVVRCTINRGWQ